MFKVILLPDENLLDNNHLIRREEKSNYTICREVKTLKFDYRKFFQIRN